MGWLEHRTVTLLTQVRFPGAARDFLQRVIFQCRLSFGVRPGGDVTVYVCDINQPSFPTPFHSVLASVSAFLPLSTVFHSKKSPGNSPFSHSVLLVFFFCLIGPFNYVPLYESLLHP